MDARLYRFEETPWRTTRSPSPTTARARPTRSPSATGPSRDGPAQIKVSDDDFGLMTYDPAFQNTRVHELEDHVHRRRQGHPRVPRLPDRAARREGLASSRSCGCCRTASSRTQGSSRASVHQVTMHTMVHENMREFIDGFRYDAHPMGILLSTVGALSTFYPEAKNVGDATNRRIQMTRLDREDPDARGLCVPSSPRPAVRLPGQRPQLRRQLPEHDVQDDRGEVPAEPRHREGARRPLHPARRPRAELLDLHDARRRLSSQGRTRTRALAAAARRSTARSTAARTKRSSTCSARSGARRTSPTSSRA
jgi:hypothetical protein